MDDPYLRQRRSTFSIGAADDIPAQALVSSEARGTNVASNGVLHHRSSSHLSVRPKTAAKFEVARPV